MGCEAGSGFIRIAILSLSRFTKRRIAFRRIELVKCSDVVVDFVRALVTAMLGMKTHLMSGSLNQVDLQNSLRHLHFRSLFIVIVVADFATVLDPNAFNVSTELIQDYQLLLLR